MMVSSTTPFTRTYDVIVLGGGNAGFTAATTAVQQGSSVLLCEKAPYDERGGNTFYTAGAYRYCFRDLTDVEPLLYNRDGTKPVPRETLDKVELGSYSEEDFMKDMKRVTNDRTDERLARILVERSRDAVGWIAENGGKWELSLHRQAYEVDGKLKFWGGMVTAFLGGGKALVEWHIETASKNGVEVLWGSPGMGLITEEDDEHGLRVVGVEVLRDGKRRERYRARGGVVLGSGGFQADPSLRARWLGPGWDLAHVRGCKYSTGDGHRMGSDVGANVAGHYSGCHSTCWDADSPKNGGNRVMTNQYTKSGYPLGLMLNTDGKRFVDEGFDLRNYTYAVFGAEVLKQPSGMAFQVWDADGVAWLRKEEYADDVTNNIRADNLAELAEKLSSHGLKSEQQFIDTITEYNEAVAAFQTENPDVVFNPAEKDKLSTQSSKMKLALAKSNWARPLKTPPFTAVKITSGVTFTFGGLDVVPQTAQVVAEATRRPITGLYCCGELLGGLFFSNYPGGSGLTAGTVFGRIAGKHASDCAAAAAAAQEQDSGENKKSGII